MLTRVDRIQVVVADRRGAVAAFGRLLDALPIREDRSHLLAARRTVLQLGASSVELLEPDGTGAVADFLAHAGGGLFAAGFATSDLAQLRAHLAARGTTVDEEAGQLYLSPDAVGMPGLRVVVSPKRDQTHSGLVRFLYEVTLLAGDFRAPTDNAATTFGLDASHFVPIRSREYGYEGVLTLFHPNRLDRIEVITPSDATKTMGRYFTRRGPSLYMCYAETDNLGAIRARLMEHAPHDWTGPRDGVLDNVFIHPKALGGVMLGLSRATFAWTWSGHPERVSPGAD